MPLGEEGEFVDPVAFRRHLRKQATLAETILNEHLKGLPYKFVFQHKIDEAYVDFCCRSHKVVIELDGDSHENKVEQDGERDRRLRAKGYEVLRFRNEDVLEHTDKVLAAIFKACEIRPRWRY